MADGIFYGICVECSALISMRRLHREPLTTQCEACASATDTRDAATTSSTARPNSRNSAGGPHFDASGRANADH